MFIDYDETTVYTVRLHVIRWEPETSIRLDSVRNSVNFPNKPGAANSAYAKFSELVGEWQAELAETKTVNVSVNVEMLVENTSNGDRISLIYWGDEVLQ